MSQEINRQLFDALRNMVEWWGYALARGANPSAADQAKVEQLVHDAFTALRAADPTYKFHL